MNSARRLQQESSTGTLITELLEATGQLVTAETDRAQASIHRRLGLTADRILLGLGVLCLSLLGGAAAITSAILALGNAWSGRYWLSALCVAAVLLLGAAPLVVILISRKDGP